MDTVYVGGALGIVSGLAVVLLIARGIRRPVVEQSFVPQGALAQRTVARRGLGIILASFAAGAATMGLVVVMLRAFIPQFAAGSAVPVSLQVLGAAALGLAPFGHLLVWRRFDAAASMPGADLVRARAQAIVSAAIVEGPIIMGVVILLLAIYVDA